MVFEASLGQKFPCWPVYLGRVLKGLFLYSVLAHDNLGLVVERDQDHRHEGGHGQAELPLEVDGHADGDEDGVDGLQDHSDRGASRLNDPQPNVKCACRVCSR